MTRDEAIRLAEEVRGTAVILATGEGNEAAQIIHEMNLDTIVDRCLREQPAPDDDNHDCHWRRLDDARREDKVVQNAAPDVQAQIDAAVERERGRVIGIFVGELQALYEKTVLDCGDNSCLFASRRGGMRTNGGCRCIERLLDAAVARERERIVELVELKRAKFNIGTRASLALNDVLDQISARSGARAGDCTKCGGPVQHRDGKPGEYDHECRSGAKGVS